MLDELQDFRKISALPALPGVSSYSAIIPAYSNTMQCQVYPISLATISRLSPFFIMFSFSNWLYSWSPVLPYPPAILRKSTCI
jgi:hypothetical protein